MDTAVLRELVEPVPACALSASLYAVLEQFQRHRCDRLVVVNAWAQPLGLLRLQRLLPYWSASSAELSQTLDALAGATAEQLLEPLAILPIDSFTSQLQPHIMTLSQRPCALTDTAGRYQGMLDHLRLLQTRLPMHPESPVSLPSFEPVARPLLPARTGLDRSTSDFSAHPLIELLERLPLPLMLQTGGGQVIVQNHVWQQQVGELQNPTEIRQAAAVLLETGTAAPDRSAACQIGRDANTCVCVCPMKNGQERVWTFIKIPLATAIDPAELALKWRSLPREQAVLDGLGEFRQALSMSKFHLAALALEAERDSWRRSELAAADDELWLVLAQDTTEQQQVTKELAAKNADLIQLNRLKDEFLACISHELKTPLTAILGLSNLLRNQALGALNERQARYAQLIHQSGRHLISIVNNILDLTRIETGQLTLTPELICISALCTSAYEQARQTHLLSTIDESAQPVATPQFALDIDPAIDSIVADEQRLRQMLTNLLSNALKFTSSGGKIGLRVERWEGWLAFTVWDTGIGIPIDKQHLIFQKFQQLENPLTRRFEGTGLGLVLTQRLARLHGGDVTFTSAEGQGSQFTLLLPPQPPAVDPAPDLLPLPSRRLALIVEAVPQFLNVLIQHLSDLGYRVAIARSGTEALEKVRRLQPAVVLLNPVLPLLSGWDILVLLKADPSTRHIPVIVTATQAEKQQAASNQADAFLSLPLQPGALQHALDRVGSEAAIAPMPMVRLTILHLCVRAPDALAKPLTLPTDLSTLLHPHPCRILEVDDLEQADLLARVWKPDVILLDGSVLEADSPPDAQPALELAELLAYFKQLSQQPFLSALPLVTLTPELTQAANQVPGLAVFPCLATLTEAGSSSLLQVLQVAAGVHWTPHLLLVDLDLLAAQGATLPLTPGEAADWLQTAAQYLQTAGFRTTLGSTWAAVVHHLHQYSIDLLLLWGRTSHLPPTVLQSLQTLVQLQPKPPILVQEDAADRGAAAWGAIAAQVLPASVSMPELLAYIRQVLKQS